jgi:ABC-type branched-subunit amino acid transport system ATPase component
MSITTVTDGAAESAVSTAIRHGPRHPIAVADLHVGYGEGPDVLAGTDLTVDEGEVVGVHGENGAGKTTLVRALGGLLGFHGGQRRVGTIEILGADDASTSSAARHRNAVATVLTERRLFGPLTVEQNLMLAVQSRRGRRGDRKRALASAIDMFPLLASRQSSAAGNLSGGEQQMLALARALVVSPRVLVLDEPAVGLSSGVIEQLVAVLRELRTSGTAILTLESDRTTLEDQADRVVELRDGAIRTARRFRPSGAEAVTSRPASAAAPGLADGLRRTPASGSAGEASRALLDIQGVTCRIGGIRVLDGVDLGVAPGRIVGLIGRNGAGKSSLLNCVSGFVRYQRGIIRVGGVVLPVARARAAALAGVARTFQEPAVFDHLTVEDNLLVALHESMSSSLLRGILPWGRAARQDHHGRRQIGDVVESLHLGDVLGEPAGPLPAGVRKRIDIARAILRRPRALLLDEPAAGLDAGEVAAVAATVERHRDATGAVVLVVDHDLTLIHRMCDDVVEMADGAVLGAGRREVGSR